MPLDKTEAVLLKSFNWSESSRTVVMFTRNAGKLALVDKGGRSMKSKRGRLVPFTRMEVTYYSSEKETSGYVSEVAHLESFSFEAEGELGRLAYGSAACELLYLLLPEEEQQVGLYNYFLSFLGQVTKSARGSLPAIFLAFFLRTLSYLGYQPTLSACVSCSTELLSDDADDASVSFDPNRGGLVCLSCQRPLDQYIRLSVGLARQLAALQTASLTEAAALPIGFEDSTRCLDGLTRFLANQTGMRSGLKSLEFLQKLKNNDLTG